MTRSLVLLTGLALGLAACDFAALESSADDFTIILGLESPSTVVGGLVIDAATGEPIEGPVTIAYESDTPGAVVDGFGDPIAEETVEGGGFNVAIAEALAPGGGREVRVTVRVRAEGYLPQRRLIALADTGAYDLTVALLAPDRPADGATTAQASAQASAAGGTDADATADTGGDAAARVTVPAGTVLTDAAGQAVSGALRMAVTSIAPGSAAADALPDPDDGSARLGLVSIGMRVGTRAVGPEAGRAVPTTIRFAADAAHPLTGRPLAAGDVVEIHRYADGAWVPFAEAPVRADAAAFGGGPFIQTDAVVTPSGDGEPEIYSASVRTPTERIRVTVERNGTPGAIPVVVATAAGRFRGTIGPRASAVTIDVPAGARSDVYATVRGTRISAPDGATCTTCRITIPPPPETIEAVLTPACPNPAERVYIAELPALTIHVREAGTTGAWFALEGAAALVTDASGAVERVELATTSVARGTRYEGKTTYLGETYEATYDVPASGTVREQLDVPSSICQ